MFKRILSALLCALLVLSGLFADSSMAEGEAALTLMIYITGSDLETAGGAATSDINEMLRSGVDPEQVNIILMTGGSVKWWGGFPSDKLCIYRVAGRRPELLEQFDSASMGQADTLSAFMDYACANFPARQYALVLWDHGGGPMNGVCYDELHFEEGQEDHLTIKELRTALEQSPFSAENKMEWIGFDACLMSAVETAHVCAPYANYMVASQETEPGTGWDYKFLKTIAESADGAQTGRDILENYFAATDASRSALTLSCVDLSKVDGIEQAMNDLFGHLDQIISPESFSSLSNSRRDARSIGRASTGSDYDLVDLYHLAQQYETAAPEQAKALCDAVEAAVVCSRSNIDDMHGLSVYYPYYNKTHYERLWKEVYSELGFAGEYLRYMNDYAELWMGEQLADWSKVSAATLPQTDDGTQTLTMELSEEQQAHFASAQLYVLDEYPSGGGYYDIYLSDDVRLENGVLSAQYAYDALYVLDEDGQPLSDALPYIVMDGAYLVRGALSEYSPSEDFWGWLDGAIKQVWLQCVPDEKGNMQITGLIELPDDEGVLTYPSMETVLLHGKQQQTLDPQLWPNIVFMRHPRVPAQTENGETAPYSQWPYPAQLNEGSLLMEYYDIDNTSAWSLGFRRQQFAGRDLQAQLVVTDTQGTSYASDLMPIKNEHVRQAIDLSVTAADDDLLRLTIDSAQTVASDLDSGLYLYGTLENRSGEPLRLTAQDFVLDGTLLSFSESSFAGSIAADQTANIQPVHFHIPADAMRVLKDSTIDRLSFTVSVMNGELDIVRTIPVELDKQIDMSGVIEPFGPAEPIAASSLGGAQYELLSLREAEDGLKAFVHIANASSEPVELSLDAQDVLINGCLFTGAVYADNAVLPASCDTYLELTVSCKTPRPTLWEPELPVIDGFDYWNITEVETLCLCAGSEWIAFDLSEAIALSASAAAEEQILADDAGALIALRGVERHNGMLRMELALCNTTDRPMKIGVASLLIDGADAPVTLCDENGGLFSETWNLPAGVSIRAGVNAAADEDASGVQIAFSVDGNEIEPALADLSSAE